MWSFLHSLFVIFIPAHTKHLSFRTILHFSSIHFLIVAHSTFSLAENVSSVHSFTAAILFGSSFRSLSLLPSMLPVFASSLLNTSSKSFRANPFGVYFGSCSTFLLSTYTPRLGEPIRTVDCLSTPISLQDFCNWSPSVLFCGRKGVKENLTGGLFELKAFGGAETEGGGVSSIRGSLFSKLTSASCTDFSIPFYRLYIFQWAYEADLPLKTLCLLEDFGHFFFQVVVMISSSSKIWGINGKKKLSK